MIHVHLNTLETCFFTNILRTFRRKEVIQSLNIGHASYVEICILLIFCLEIFLTSFSGAFHQLHFTSLILFAYVTVNFTLISNPISQLFFFAQHLIEFKNIEYGPDTEMASSCHFDARINFP